MQTGYQHNISPLSAQARNGTVVLFGEVLADIFPDKTVLGGAPFNVARHLKAFGQHPVLITRLGGDELGEQVLNVMTDNGMDTIGIQCSKRHPTGRVQVHLEHGVHQFEILSDQAYDYIHPALVRMITLSSNPALVYFGTLSQRFPVSARALKNVLRSTEAPKFLDINLRTPWYEEKTIMQSLHDADVLKLNDTELAEISVMFALQGKDSHSQAEELMQRFNLEQVLVTCGEAGAWHMNHSGKIVEASAIQSEIKVVDTVGAGDGFAAVCMLGTLQRWPVARILERANSFAASLCEIRGAIPDREDFYEPFIREWWAQ